jgi:hypothetical protein
MGATRRRPLGRASLPLRRMAGSAARTLARPALLAGVAGPIGRRLVLAEIPRRPPGGIARIVSDGVRDGGALILVADRHPGWWQDTVAGAEVRLRIGRAWWSAWAEAIDPVDPRFTGLAKTVTDLRGPGLLRQHGLEVDEHGRIHQTRGGSGVVFVLCLLEGS